MTWGMAKAHIVLALAVACINGAKLKLTGSEGSDINGIDFITSQTKATLTASCDSDGAVILGFSPLSFEGDPGEANISKRRGLKPQCQPACALRG